MVKEIVWVEGKMDEAAGGCMAVTAYGCRESGRVMDGALAKRSILIQSEFQASPPEGHAKASCSARGVPMAMGSN